MITTVGARTCGRDRSVGLGDMLQKGYWQQFRQLLTEAIVPLVQQRPQCEEVSRERLFAIVRINVLPPLAEFATQFSMNNICQAPSLDHT